MVGALPGRLRDAIATGRARNASDVHLECGLPPVLRVDGVLCRIDEIALGQEDMAEMVLAFAARPCDDASEYSAPWCDGELGTLRVHVYRSLRGTTLAIRLLPREIPPYDSLRLPECVARLVEKPRGLVVVAGPTGSGKSTTVAALVDRLNARAAKRIVTLEDPIEYRYSQRRSIVTQREIGRDMASLAGGLRGVLRADPDVIVVGELRDAQDISGTLTAAETGHLVLTTVHTGDAAQTVDRLIDAFEGIQAAQIRAQVAGVLLGVVCQRLVRRADGKGRRALVEVMIATDGVRNLIREDKSHQLRNAIATGRQYGMQTFAQHAAELVAARELTREEALSAGIEAFEAAYA